MPEELTPAQIAYEAWVRSKENPLPSPTPGQVAYAAYRAAYGDADWIPRWLDLCAESHHAWEAAAEAVRTAYQAELAQAWAQGQHARQTPPPC